MFSLQILNSSAALDVDGISPTAIFGDGVNHSECIFTIQDDEIPEVNETFSIELSLSTPKTGTVISPSVAYLIILANDDAFGNIGFNEVSEMTARVQDIFIKTKHRLCINIIDYQVRDWALHSCMLIILKFEFMLLVFFFFRRLDP